MSRERVRNCRAHKKGEADANVETEPAGLPDEPSTSTSTVSSPDPAPTPPATRRRRLETLPLVLNSEEEEPHCKR